MKSYFEVQEAQKGFTLIELMIVVVIVGILASVALPAYQSYIIRSKVTEGLMLVSVAKLAVVETFQVTGIVANSNASAKYTFAPTAQVSDISIISGGAIKITYGIPQVSGSTLVITPNINGAGLTAGTSDPVNWVCKSAGSSASGTVVGTYGILGTLPSRFAPANCRN